MCCFPCKRYKHLPNEMSFNSLFAMDRLNKSLDGLLSSGEEPYANENFLSHDKMEEAHQMTMTAGYEKKYDKFIDERTRKFVKKDKTGNKRECWERTDM